jgi:hypothetical protein
LYVAKYETGLAKAPEVLEGMEGSLQGPELGSGGSFHPTPDCKTQGSDGAVAALTCTSFGWTTTWKSFSSPTPLGGRATEAYLKSHPEESDEIHVIVG